MCFVSAVGDHYKRELPTTYPGWFVGDKFVPGYTPGATPGTPSPLPSLPKWFPSDLVQRKEFEELKKKVEEIAENLRKAHELDVATNQPDCPMDEKVALIKAMADYFGVDIKDVFVTDK